MERIRESAKSFKDLLVWQKAHQLVLNIYNASGKFPKEELFGLTSQIRRSAVSIPANIAEGFKRNGIKDKLRFLNIAHSSLEETRYYLILAQDLEYSNTTSTMEMLEEVSKLLNGYCKAIMK
jgi:four helix bundle protein